MEFLELAVIGVGQFGKVSHQYLNRLDGCNYAIKKSIKLDISFEKRALNEVWGHTVLGKHYR
ncbi:wee1-like protein kinase isoform 1-T2 [Glossina fuscipes fuscipes]